MARPDFDLSKTVRPNILALAPYRCARDDYSTGVLLDANENTHGPALSKKWSMDTKDSMDIHDSIDSTDQVHLERYPDPHQTMLKKRICRMRPGTDPSNVFVGVGSDESIDLAIRCFCVPGTEKIAVCPPTYGMYSVAAQINDVGVVKVPLDSSFQLNLDALFNALENDRSIKLVFLCSPGNPTGALIRHEDIKAVLEFAPFKGVVVVDEAYVDFSVDASGSNTATIASWVSTYPNLIVTQTLSKAFGLAGIRLGISFSSPEIAKIFNNTKAPYNISTPTSLIARAALSPQGIQVMTKNIHEIIEQRTHLSAALLTIPRIGRIIGGSDANFILVEILNQNGVPDNDTAHAIYKTLAESEGVVVRFRGMEHGCTGCLRITVGTASENALLLEKLNKLLS